MFWFKIHRKLCLFHTVSLLFLSLIIVLLHHLHFGTPGIRNVGRDELIKTKILTVDCKRIIQHGDKEEISRAKQEMKLFPKLAISPETYINLSNNCQRFKKQRGYILRSFKETEKDFPIAFSIVIYKDIEQFERLLRAIYRPQNYYCIHVDKKSPSIFHYAVQGITDCFPNVFIASTLVDVRWAEFTVLEADLICMRDLWKRYKNWKYFINLTGQEFPLRTNNELVKILKSLNGESIVKGTKPRNRAISNRFQYVYRGAKRTEKVKQAFRYNFTFVKGSTHVVLSRNFVNFTLNSHVANTFLEWVKDTGFPDETFLPSLFTNVKLKTLNSSQDRRKMWRWNTRFKNWGNFPCHGKVVRRICINGVGDLHFITRRPELFVNKFYLDYQYLALDCMEQWLHNKTLAEYNRVKKTIPQGK